jgi:NADPH:quinone reductase
VGRAVVIEQPGGPEVMRLAELPRRRLGASQVRVNVEAAGENPVDAGHRADPEWAALRTPCVVGYEFAGRVDECGELVDGLQVGDASGGCCPFAEHSGERMPTRL